MKLIDFHCDAISKLLIDPKLSFHEQHSKLDVTIQDLIQSNTLLQVFAIYIPRNLPNDIHYLMQSIHIFYEKIASYPQIKLVENREDLEECLLHGKIGALLSIEGVDCLEGKLFYTQLLHRLGIRAAGLTWNEANWAADGIMENRGGGLTDTGKQFITQCEQTGIIIDCSHLSVKGFWDLIDMSTKPFIASHSNAKQVCSHVRNLDDNQIKAMIRRNGRIGITYVPWFVSNNERVNTTQLLHHIEHIASLGGENIMMLGSDFDGIDTHMVDLKRPTDVIHLEQLLLQYYEPIFVEKIMWKNAYDFLIHHL